jgi:hypothetical protein
MKKSRKTIIKIYIFLCISFVVGCTARSTNDPGVPMETLKEKIISNGNESAYERLGIAYLDYNISQEVMIYSTIMANKYHSPEAYFYVYHDLVSVHENGLADMSKDLREIAIQYLKKSASLNDFGACDELGELYLEGKYIQKDSIIGSKFKKLGERRWERKPWYYELFH